MVRQWQARHDTLGTPLPYGRWGFDVRGAARAQCPGPPYGRRGLETVLPPQVRPAVTYGGCVLPVAMVGGGAVRRKILFFLHSVTVWPFFGLESEVKQVTAIGEQ